MTTLTLDVQKIRDAAATSPEARKALEVLAPEAFAPDGATPITDRITVRAGSYIQVPMVKVKKALVCAEYADYLFIVARTGEVGVCAHVSSDHDCPTLTGFTSTQDR